MSPAIGGVARFVEPPAPRAPWPSARWQTDRRLEVLNDGGDLGAVPSTDAIHLFDNLAVLLHQPRVERMGFMKRLEILHRQADVEVVRARLQNVLAGPRRFGGHHGIDRRVEKYRPQAREQLIERLAVLQRELRTGFPGRVCGGGKRLGSARQDELAGGQVVERAAVDPEELGVVLNVGERRGVDGGFVRDDRFEDVAHLEVVRVALIVKDVASCDGGLVQVPDECLFPQRQRIEAIGVDLDDSRLVHALRAVFPIGGAARRPAAARPVPPDAASESMTLLFQQSHDPTQYPLHS